MSSPGHGVVWPGTKGTLKDIWCCWCVVVIIALLWIMHTSVKRNMSHCVSLHPRPCPTLFFISLLLISAIISASFLYLVWRTRKLYLMVEIWYDVFHIL